MNPFFKERQKAIRRLICFTWFAILLNISVLIYDLAVKEIGFAMIQCFFLGICFYALSINVKTKKSLDTKLKNEQYPEMNKEM